ncbi:hypothetical protein P692DRAFT_20841063, partial [Suillus brevipes Sb2]
MPLHNALTRPSAHSPPKALSLEMLITHIHTHHPQQSIGPPHHPDSPGYPLYTNGALNPIQHHSHHPLSHTPLSHHQHQNSLSTPSLPQLFSLKFLGSTPDRLYAPRYVCYTSYRLFSQSLRIPRTFVRNAAVRLLKAWRASLRSQAEDPTEILFQV